MTNKNIRKVVRHDSGLVLVERARWCDTFLSRLRGFTFRRSLDPGEGLVLVESSESRLNTAIHMLFVPFELGVIWVDSSGKVVDSVIAKPWRLAYTPKVPARYVIEAEPGIVRRVKEGDQIEFLE